MFPFITATLDDDSEGGVDNNFRRSTSNDTGVVHTQSLTESLYTDDSSFYTGVDVLSLVLVT